MTLHKTNDPFDVIGACGRRESIAHGVVILRGFALEMERSWAKKLMQTKPFKLVAVALANKMARIAFAIMRGRTTYSAAPV
jgi:transposase